MQTQTSTFLSAILQTADESLGIQPRTFSTIKDACEYIDELINESAPTAPPKPTHYIPHEVYQYVLDNEDQIKDIAEFLQAKYSNRGFLNYLDVPSLNCIYMKCMNVEDILFDEDGSGVDGEEEEMLVKEQA